MIFGRTSNAGKEFVLIGLSNENIEKLKTGEAMSVGPFPNDSAMSNLVVIIVVGETELDMAVALKKLAPGSPETSTNEFL